MQEGYCLKQDLPKLLKSMQVGTDRIREIVLLFHNFSCLDEAEFKAADIHEGIDKTVKEYSQLPLVECYPRQLNQALINLLGNAIDALEESSRPHLIPSLQLNPLAKA